jgi:hypothetical protein
MEDDLQFFLFSQGRNMMRVLAQALNQVGVCKRQVNNSQPGQFQQDKRFHTTNGRLKMMDAAFIVILYMKTMAPAG